MKIALIGYGKMGKMLDRIAPDQGCEVVARLDHPDFTQKDLANAEVAIDFTTPEAVRDNLEKLADYKTNTVIGTTGWLEHKAEIEAHGQNIGIIWSPNFSIGVNAFFKIVKEAAHLMSQRKEYEAWAYEIHHSAKKDAPSGTLLQLVEEVKKGGFGRPINVASNRAGSIPGTHEIGFDSPSDSITLRHTARNREGFAHGALVAAKWITGRKGFYEFSDIVFE